MFCDVPEEARQKLWRSFVTALLVTLVPLGLLMAVSWWLSG